MSRKKHQPAQPAPIGAPETDVAPALGSGPTSISLRLSAGKHAVKAAEIEIMIDGSRLAGGNGIVEFDLFAETWVDIHVIRS